MGLNDPPSPCKPFVPPPQLPPMTTQSVFFGFAVDPLFLSFGSLPPLADSWSGNWGAILLYCSHLPVPVCTGTTPGHWHACASQSLVRAQRRYEDQRPGPKRCT